MTDLFFGERIEIENAKYIKIGGCVADITRLTALADSDQINSLTWLLENLLGEKETEQTELRDRCQAAAGVCCPIPSTRYWHPGPINMNFGLRR